MNELNPLLYALNDIDTRYIKPKKKKRPIALMIAAAAVMVLVLTGYSNMEEEYRPEGKDVMIYYDDGSVFGYDLTTFDIAVPDQYKNEDAPGPSGTYEARGVLPSELFAEFGLTLLTSDNFSEKLDPETIYPYDYIDNHDGQPCYIYEYDGIRFWYNLYDKKIKRLVFIDAFYSTTEDIIRTEDNGETCRYRQILTLKDGSKCRVSEYGATFGYEGVGYNVSIMPLGVAKYDVDNFIKLKQVIKDLGIVE